MRFLFTTAIVMTLAATIVVLACDNRPVHPLDPDEDGAAAVVGEAGGAVDVGTNDVGSSDAAGSSNDSGSTDDTGADDAATRDD